RSCGVLAAKAELETVRLITSIVSVATSRILISCSAEARWQSNHTQTVGCGAIAAAPRRPVAHPAASIAYVANVLLMIVIATEKVYSDRILQLIPAASRSLA